MTDDSLELAEVQGVGLATFALTVNLLRMLRDRGAISNEDAQDLLSTSLQVLERDDHISEQAVHNARALLQGVAKQFGVAPSKPN